MMPVTITFQQRMVVVRCTHSQFSRLHYEMDMDEVQINQDQTGELPWDNCKLGDIVCIIMYNQK